MKIIKAFVLFLLLSLSVSTHENGVSAALAQSRRAAISDLAYELSFDIPAQRLRRVPGRVAVLFNLRQPQEVVLDFKAAPQDVKRVEVNGKKSDYIFENEHIVLPASSFAEPGSQRVEVSFVAGDQSLNRRDDYLYTLLVPDRARTLFPCFDQPDMKAAFTLQLALPEGWTAVANSPVVAETPESISFATTEPLSTYLFSFVAGKFQKQDFTNDKGRQISCYHREDDPAKLAQLDGIARQVFDALDWQEAFTGIPYPFAKYDFIILPGFQFGGMEHTGATLYNDTQMFLGPDPTPAQLLTRAQLIAHETSHMWFGDLVTMRWFDDVWTKEVFANYFASRIVEPAFPDVDLRLNTMRDYGVRALAQDRTPGSTAIRQDLGNLSDAGLVYNNIIYCKSPLVMEKIVEIMGPEAFREGIRRYLRQHSYANATWDELVATLDSLTPRDLRGFSQAWVGSEGMPEITISYAEPGVVVARQSDPMGRGIAWPQSFDVRACAQGRDTTLTVEFADGQTECRLPISFRPDYILPNTDGRAYGKIVPDSASLLWLVDNWKEIPQPVARLAAVMTLNENYLSRGIGHADWLASLVQGLESETEPLIASTLIGYLSVPMLKLPGQKEDELWQLAQKHPLPSVRNELLRLLPQVASSNKLVDSLYNVWQSQSKPLSETDYTNMAYELAYRLPDRQSEILGTQRSRLTNPDRLRQFDFIAPAVSADPAVADSVFNALLLPQNRRIEPWSLAALRFVCRDNPARILPALEILPEVQRTGDIFMPGNWCAAVLARQHSPRGRAEIRRFLDGNAGMPQLLKRKVLQALPAFFEETAE